MSAIYAPAVGDCVVFPSTRFPEFRNRTFTIGAIGRYGVRLDWNGRSWSIPLQWAYDWDVTTAAHANRAYVRALLAERQPAFAAALEAVTTDLEGAVS